MAEDLLEIVHAAAGSGHQFEWDPPAGLTSLRGRWTCMWCGNAVLMRHDETCYGSAAGKDCVPKPKTGQVWESVEGLMEGLQVEVVEEHGAKYLTKIIVVPFGLRSSYQVGQPLIVHRSRLRDPAVYKYGYKLIKDVTE
jgi:hypothetical protein